MRYKNPGTIKKYFFSSGLPIWLSASFCLFFSPVFSLAIYDSIWVNTDTVGKYNKLEISVIMTAQYMNPFDYNQVNLKAHFISPSGNMYQADGFYYRDYTLNPPNGALIPNGQPYWKVRFCPNETGTWSYMLVCKDATGTAYSATFTFVCLPSDNPGFISNSDTYFQQFSNGEPFFHIGMSIPWNLYEGGFYVYEEWMDSLKANQSNFIKIIMAPWSFGIEWNNTGLGNYTNRLDIAFWLDWVLNKAEEDGLYLQLCPLIHNEVSTQSNNDWAWSPYNAANGGPCQNTWDFYTNTTARRFYKQKLRYINSRWGYSSHFAAWELFTETDNTGDFTDHHDQINSWLISTGQYLDSLDIHHHPISPSYAFISNDPVMWENNIVDFTQIHLYKTTNDLELYLFAATRHYLSHWDKPNIIGEFGLGHNPPEIIALDPTGISFHNSLWATAFSGSFGTATAWHWDSYIHSQNLYHHFSPVATFMKTVDLLEKDYQPVAVFCTSDNNLDAEIFPGYKVLFSPAPENEFVVETTGDLIPRNSYLNYMLYGALFNNSKNPPHFYVNYTKAGQFKVRTGGNVVLSTLKIWIDGAKVLDQTAHANSTYTVNVAAGNHEIFVENSGSFYIEVEKYIFANYAPVCRSFALQDPTQVSGWVQNRYYNWEYIDQHGEPSPLAGGQMNFTGLSDSYYSVQWYEGSTGLMDSSLMAATTDNLLTVDVPEIVWDAAYKINYLDHSIQADFTASETEICKGESVTFTEVSVGIVTGRQWQFPGGTPSSSTLPSPQVTYNQSGVFNVTLKVYNAFDTVVVIDTALIQVEAIPAIPGTITGSSQVCQGETAVLYSVDPVEGADYYAWFLPPGATGFSITHSVLVTYSLQALSGNIYVRASNSCGNSAFTSKYIHVTHLTGNAGVISGPDSVCQGDNGLYEVEPIAHATSYQWTLPYGMSGTSATNQIQITFDSAMVCGLVMVEGLNACGQGAAASLPVCINPLPTIPQQPRPGVVEFSQDASFDIPLRSNMYYQWQTISSNQEGWINLADTGSYYGTSTHELYVFSPSPSMNEKEFRCIVTAECDPAAISQPATLYVVPHGWMMTVTSSYHRLYVPMGAHPTINNQPIQPGDYIGVFFEDDDRLVCAGAKQWKGDQPVTILAYGDNPATPQKDGFAAGDPFIWKLYSMADQADYEATAAFLLGPGVYTQGKLSSLESLEAYHYTDHIISLPAGWSGISSFLVPANDSVEVIFEPILTTLDILRDQANIFWPNQNINTIIHWDPDQGYFIKTEVAVTLTINGLYPTDRMVSLTPGWNILPVLSDVPVSIIESGIFSSLGTTLLVVKEIAGPRVYWPSMNLFTLLVLEPGKAYQILVTAPSTIHFPEDP